MSGFWYLLSGETYIFSVISVKKKGLTELLIKDNYVTKLKHLKIAILKKILYTALDMKQTYIRPVVLILTSSRRSLISF